MLCFRTFHIKIGLPGQNFYHTTNLPFLQIKFYRETPERNVSFSCFFVLFYFEKFLTYYFFIITDIATVTDSGGVFDFSRLNQKQ